MFRVVGVMVVALFRPFRLRRLLVRDFGWACAPLFHLFCHLYAVMLAFWLGRAPRGICRRDCMSPLLAIACNLLVVPFPFSLLPFSERDDPWIRARAYR